MAGGGRQEELLQYSVISKIRTAANPCERGEMGMYKQTVANVILVLIICDITKR